MHALLLSGFRTKQTAAWCLSAFHPNCLILIETQSELIDRQRTAVHRGRFRYKHWLHLGRIPCSLACGCITKQQTIPWRQPSFLIDISSPASFFFLLTSCSPCYPRFSSIMFRGSGWVPWRSEKALSWLQPSVGVITAWTNVILQSSPHVSVKNNTGDIMPLCPSIKSLLPNRGCKCFAVTHTTPRTQPAHVQQFPLCYPHLASVCMGHTDASASLMDFHMD